MAILGIFGLALIGGVVGLALGLLGLVLAGVARAVEPLNAFGRPVVVLLGFGAVLPTALALLALLGTGGDRLDPLTAPPEMRNVLIAAQKQQDQQRTWPLLGACACSTFLLVPVGIGWFVAPRPRRSWELLDDEV